MMKRILGILLSTFVLALFASAQSFSFDDLMKVKRVGSPDLSPNGKQVVFVIGTVEMEANRTINHLFIINTDGTGKRQLSSGTTSAGSPKWSPDGKWIAYTTAGQVWKMAPDGSNKKQVSGIATGAGNPVWSPDGKWIAFGSDVYPECSDNECNKREEEKAENSKVTAKITDRLLYRHWVEWRDRKRSHVFVVSSDGGTARDITPGDFDSPPYAASTGRDYAFSPDGKEIAFIRNPDKVEAISTNSDIYVVPIEGGAARNITVANRGYDTSPVYTPNGKYIIFLSMAREGFEADRNRVMRYDRATGEAIELSSGFDLQASNLLVASNSRTVFFTAQTRGLSPIYSVPVEPDFRLRIATHVRPLVQGVYAGSLNISGDARTLVFTSSSMSTPAEIMRAGTDASGIAPITKENTNISLPKAESLEWKGSGDTPIHGFLLKPANFDSSKKYPLLVLIHGGPQSAWTDSWSYRWNAQIWSNNGYVVFLPNPRGSTGYGQQFVDEITADWGGRVFDDLKNGIAEVVEMPFIDENNIGGAGASYGGYMVNWILGHNDDPRFKFKTLVSHAGVYNLHSFTPTTEELWFPLWEFKGMPWDNPEFYDKWSPHLHVKNFATPTLVTQGELDYRVPTDQSLQLFTALQYQEVESRMIVFPDEGHWILKPQNSELWYRQVTGWLDKHLK